MNRHFLTASVSIISLPRIGNYRMNEYNICYQKLTEKNIQVWTSYKNLN